MVKRDRLESGAKRLVGTLGLVGAALAQGTKINLPLPPDPGTGGGDVVEIQASPDGAWLGYRADQELVDVHELFVVPLDGSRLAHKLNAPLVPGGQVTAFRFSADSAHVVFVADGEEDDRFELYAAPTDGKTPAVRLTGSVVSGGDVGDSSFDAPFLVSEATQRVVFPADLEEDNRFELYSAPLDGSAPPIRLSGPMAFGRDVSELLLLTLDGTRALYLSDEGVDERPDLWIVPVDGSSAPIRLNAPHGPGRGVVADGGPAARLTPDGLHVVYRADDRVLEGFELFRARLDGGEPPEALFSVLPAFADVFEFDLTPDGELVLLVADFETEGLRELWRIVTLGNASPKKLSGPLIPQGNVSGLGTLDGPFRISPDGTRVVYRADATVNESFELFSAPVDGHEPAMRLTPALGPGRKTTGYRLSPDGRRVVYLANPHDFSLDELFSVPIAGGAVHRLSGPLVSGARVQRDFRVGDQRVVFRVDAEVDERFELLSAPIAGFPRFQRALDGEPLRPGPLHLTPLLHADSDVDSGLLLLPGERVAYLADLDNEQQKEAYVSPLDGSQAPLAVSGLLTEGPPVGDVLAFGFAGARVWYSANQDSARRQELFSVLVEDTLVRAKLHDQDLHGGSVQQPRASPDGARIVYRSDPAEPSSYQMRSVAADGSEAPVLLSPLAQTSGGDAAEGFALAPGGDRVVFRGDLGSQGVIELHEAPLDGGTPALRLCAALSGNQDVETDVSISPDGQWVVYRADQDVPDRIEIYAVRSDGSTSPVKLNGPLIPEGDVSEIVSSSGRNLRISPDSARVVFVADAVIDGTSELFSAPIDGSAAAVRLHAPLPAGRFAAPEALTPDGGTVLFRSNLASTGIVELYSVPIDGSQAPVRLSQGFSFGSGVGRVRLTPDGGLVLFTAHDGHDSLYVVPLDGSLAVQEIGAPQMSSGEIIRHVFPAPDGLHAVYVAEGTLDRMYTVRVDGSEAPRLLAELDSFVGDLVFAAADELVFRAVPAFSSQELLHVPLLGTAPPERLHPALPFGRNVTGFAVDATGTRVLYRADLEADERYELYLQEL